MRVRPDSFSSQIGIYLLAMGSACGLGNLWRFPYIVGENGGGAFVLLYFFVALVVGVPVMIGELMIGRALKGSAIKATQILAKKFSEPRIKYFGYACWALCLMILSYYVVISGWVLFFVVQFAKALVSLDPIFSLKTLNSNPLLQLSLASVHLIFAGLIVGRGVQEGIEKWIGALVPSFFILLLILVSSSLSLPTGEQALRFLFYPDFSRLTWSSLSEAVGHVFFTLGTGFGTLMLFGSYMKDETHLPTVGFRLASIDTFLSLIAGLLIFPVALSASHLPLTDPGLMFESLPQFLIEKTGGRVFGLGFFLFLYLAALGASVSLLEVATKSFQDYFKATRKKATIYSTLGVLFLSLLPTLLGQMIEKSSGRASIVLIDSVLVNWLMPLFGLGLCFLITKGLSENELRQAFVEEVKIESQALFPHWYWAMRRFVPLIIVVGFIARLVALF